jgi:hypothetical protein
LNPNKARGAAAEGDATIKNHNHCIANSDKNQAKPRKKARRTAALRACNGG